MKRLAWGLVIALAILHQDFWLWDDRRLVFGWLPIGLGYHVLLSLAAGVAWALVCRFAWPEHIEAWAACAAPAARDERGPRSET
jgi:hypothetical protein